MKAFISDFCIILLLMCSATVWAAPSGSQITHVRVLETDDFFTPVNLDGVVFPPYANVVFRHKSDSPNDTKHGAKLELVFAGGDVGAVGNPQIDVADSINVTFDVKGQQLYALDGLSVRHAATERRGNNVGGNIDANRFGIKEPVGIATNPEKAALYVLARQGSELITVNAPDQKKISIVDSLKRGRVSKVRLGISNTDELRGLAYNPEDRHLYTINVASRELYSISGDGSLTVVGRFPDSDWREPTAIVFAPSLDQTDDPLRWHLFIVSSTGVHGEVSEWSSIINGN